MGGYFKLLLHFSRLKWLTKLVSTNIVKIKCYIYCSHLYCPEEDHPKWLSTGSWKFVRAHVGGPYWCLILLSWRAFHCHLFWRCRRSVSAPDTSWPIASRAGGCKLSRDVFPLTIMTALLGGGEDMSSNDEMIGPPIELWVGLDCTAGWSGALLV